MAGIVSPERVSVIMQFVNEHGETEACKEYNINIESLHRYQRLSRFNETKNPKILLIDMETCFMKARIWHIGKNYVQHDQIIQDWFFLSWSARWLFSNETMCDVVTPEEVIRQDDRRICQSAWQLLNDCDILIGHNLLGFDLPRLNTRFLLNGFAPPLPFQTIDTLKMARKYFSFSSNKLDYLGRLMRNKGKIKTDFDLWIDCEQGNGEALARMVEYNKEDVNLLENIYVMLRPWLKSHPNLPLIMESKERGCPNCGSFNIEDTGTFYYTPMNRYGTVRCLDCGATSHERLSDIKPSLKKVLLRADAR